MTDNNMKKKSKKTKRPWNEIWADETTIYVDLATAMQYLHAHGLKCKNRSTYMKYERLYDIPYLLTQEEEDRDPRLKSVQVRRFEKSKLEHFVRNINEYKKTQKEVEEYDQRLKYKTKR